MDYYVLTTGQQVFRQTFQGRWERLGSFSARFWLPSPGPDTQWQDSGWFNQVPDRWQRMA